MLYRSIDIYFCKYCHLNHTLNIQICTLKITARLGENYSPMNEQLNLVHNNKSRNR